MSRPRTLEEGAAGYVWKYPMEDLQVIIGDLQSDIHLSIMKQNETFGI